jgi:hypothetical protein
MAKRILEVYGGKTFESIDINSGELITYAAVPMFMFRQPDKFTMTMQMWRSKESFELKQDSLGPKFDRPFVPEDLAAFRTAYAPYIDPMEAAAMDWLGVAPETHDLQTISVDLQSLIVSASARHKTRKSVTQRATETDQDFEDIKTDYPAMVGAYNQLIWTYAQAKDGRYARFE